MVDISISELKISKYLKRLKAWKFMSEEDQSNSKVIEVLSVRIAALGSLLIKKGIIKKQEYIDELTAVQEDFDEFMKKW